MSMLGLLNYTLLRRLIDILSSRSFVPFTTRGLLPLLPTSLPLLQQTATVAVCLGIQ